MQNVLMLREEIKIIISEGKRRIVDLLVFEIFFVTKCALKYCLQNPVTL